MKDEALNPAAYRMESLPIARPSDQIVDSITTIAKTLEAHARQRHEASRALHDWLTVTWEMRRPANALTEPFGLSGDAFAHALRAALPARRRNLSVAAVAAIRVSGGENPRINGAPSFHL
jgi:hypothetical protein